MTEKTPLETPLKPNVTLNASGKKEWRRVLALKDKEWKPDDIGPLSQYCLAYQTVQHLEEQSKELEVALKDIPLTDTQARKGMETAYFRYLEKANTLRTSMVSIGEKLGFSPLSRQKIKSESSNSVKWGGF